MTRHEPTLPEQVTELLVAVRSGEAGAWDRLIPLVYHELRELAESQLRQEHGARTLNPTGLVHEAYLKLMAAGTLDASSRAHFLGIAARAMRQVLVDAARRRNASKRGAGWIATTLSGAEQPIEVEIDDLIALDAALEQIDARQRQIVEYRFFGGLEEREIAELLGITERTVRRDWVKARAWLYQQLYPHHDDERANAQSDP
jgi:RNA polymerase sigma factor (TIGR02999 family)